MNANFYFVLLTKSASTTIFIGSEKTRVVTVKVKY